MTDTNTKTKYPSAVYAAAGVGDLVYEQLRKLQDKAIALGAEAGAQAPQWKKKVAEFGAKVDANKVRDGVVTSTQFAADRAGKLYEVLVTRGEKAFAASEPKTAATKAPKAAEPAEPAEAPVAPVAKKAVPRKKTA
jgi:heparin binding hemagglutinin HbhA